MAVLNYKIKQNKELALFEFDLTKNLEPEDLKSIVLPDPVKEGFASKILILSGRGPVWLYAFLTHYFHPCKTVAVFEPRLNAGIVVQSHTNEVMVGDFVEVKNIINED